MGKLTWRLEVRHEFISHLAFYRDYGVILVGNDPSQASLQQVQPVAFGALESYTASPRRTLKFNLKTLCRDRENNVNQSRDRHQHPPES